MNEFRIIDEVARICINFGYSCGNCPIYDIGDESECILRIYEHKDEAIKAIEKWNEKHPRKTYLMDFFEKFPDAKVLPSGEIPVCIRYVYSTADVDCSKSTCAMCWNKPMEEE